MVLIVDERSQINSRVLAAAERNTRQCAFGGHNSNELWGGLPVVLLFGDDYQLLPIATEGAIQGYAKQRHRSLPHGTTKTSTPSQLLTYQGTHLFVNVMTQSVFMLHENYRVKCPKFRNLLARLRIGKPTDYDAREIMKLHINNYEGDHNFMNSIQNSTETMWLYANNADKETKNNEKLVDTSKRDRVPVAMLDCYYDSNKEQGMHLNKPYLSHFKFKDSSYIDHTDICIGARVAIQTVNYLPEIGLYNGAFGTVKEIVYHDRPLGPNDKEHNHLPDYVVVDIPHLKLPKYIKPWDDNHKTVRHLVHIISTQLHLTHQTCACDHTARTHSYENDWMQNQYT